MRRCFLAIMLALLLPNPAHANCRAVSFQGQDFTVCEYEAGADIQTYLYDDNGQPFGHFSALRDALDDNDLTLTFAMNGGMYHSDRRPVGLYIEDGKALARLHNKPGPGNFSMLPNGVFFIADETAQVLSSDQYLAAAPSPDFATQSGPMLVISGALHPRFKAGSTSRRVRNGVGIRDSDGAVIFVISESAVNFHDFASLFRDELGCDNALYLDGVVSKLYAPDLPRHDLGLPMGPMIGVVEAKEPQ